MFVARDKHLVPMANHPTRDEVVYFGSGTSDDVFVQQVNELRWILHGKEPDSSWRDEIMFLWAEVNANYGPELAWVEV